MNIAENKSDFPLKNVDFPLGHVTFPEGTTAGCRLRHPPARRAAAMRRRRAVPDIASVSRSHWDWGIALPMETWEELWEQTCCYNIFGMNK